MKNFHFILIFICFFIVSPILSFIYASNQREIQFAGHDWVVVNGGPRNPGPNYWSNSEKSVWVDSLGRLHLTIKKVDNIWYCSAVACKKFTNFGEYRFLVEGAIDKLDNNVVFGMFVYANDTAEIDIEVSKWGQNLTKKGSYTVQPWYVEGNKYYFPINLDSGLSTHFFNWRKDSIEFGSLYGHHHSNPDQPEAYIARWIYKGKNIPDKNITFQTYINFWLFRGEPPVDTTALEVIIKDVELPDFPQSIEKRSSLLPSNLKLFNIYPNPFNSQAKIEIALDRPEDVDINIYDIQGKSLLSMHRNKNQIANSISIIWDGKDKYGATASSGVYFCVVETNESIVSKKLILLR